AAAAAGAAPLGLHGLQLQSSECSKLWKAAREKALKSKEQMESALKDIDTFIQTIDDNEEEEEEEEEGEEEEEDYSKSKLPPPRLISVGAVTTDDVTIDCYGPEEYFVFAIEKGSLADRAGLRLGDRIFAINGVSTSGLTIYEICDLADYGRRPYEVLVLSEDEAELYKELNIPVSLNLPNIVRTASSIDATAADEKLGEKSAISPWKLKKWDTVSVVMIIVLIIQIIIVWHMMNEVMNMSTLDVAFCDYSIPASIALALLMHLHASVSVVRRPRVIFWNTIGGFVSIGLALYCGAGAHNCFPFYVIRIFTLFFEIECYSQRKERLAPLRSEAKELMKKMAENDKKKAEESKSLPAKAQ
ncbi:hypothetical protein PFISCL1PPCAC_8436, partial [Pristionchus fissidentatus]